MQALADSGLVVTGMVPLKGEMSVAAPKKGAKEPSTLDTVVVCRHRGSQPAELADPTPAAMGQEAVDKLRALAEHGVKFGTGDIRSVVRGTVLSLLTRPEGSFDPALLVKEASVVAEWAIGVLGYRSTPTAEP